VSHRALIWISKLGGEVVGGRSSTSSTRNELQPAEFMM
jgi:hypothetical protein